MMCAERATYCRGCCPHCAVLYEPERSADERSDTATGDDDDDADDDDAAAAYVFDGDFTRITLAQISSCMKAWSAAFGVESMTQSLNGQSPAVQAAFQALIQ
jgi:hypothetical protein